MLTPEEEKFLAYWGAQRQHKKAFLKKFTIGLPVVSLLAVAFFINFLSGWYRKADNQLRKNESLVIVIMIAVVSIIVFYTLFSIRYRWEQNEAAYSELLNKQEADRPKNENDLS